jgi:hypothetical protein
VNFSFIVAARWSNASEKLPAAPLGGRSEPARGSVGAVGERSRAPGSGRKRHFFLAMEKKWPHSAEKSGPEKSGRQKN